MRSTRLLLSVHMRLPLVIPRHQAYLVASHMVLHQVLAILQRATILRRVLTARHAVQSTTLHHWEQESAPLDQLVCPPPGPWVRAMVKISLPVRSELVAQRRVPGVPATLETPADPDPGQATAVTTMPGNTVHKDHTIISRHRVTDLAIPQGIHRVLTLLTQDAA